MLQQNVMNPIFMAYNRAHTDLEYEYEYIEQSLVNAVLRQD